MEKKTIKKHGRGPFFERCYALLRKVPKGKVTTYKALAQALGTRAYRAVGQAMNRNPYAPKVPCHRVVASDGSLHGFAHGLRRKAEMLKKEGIVIENEKVVDFEKKVFAFRKK
jgi:methylated-DNA-[protein]-cysteine S-methyltransferase